MKENKSVFLVGLITTVIMMQAIADAKSPGVAESTVQPDRLISSQGYIHYNYNAHLVEIDMAGERVMMYRYNWIRLKPPVTKADVEKLIDLKSIDSKDGPTFTGKAPLCDETKSPTWIEPDVTPAAVK